MDKKTEFTQKVEIEKNDPKFSFEQIANGKRFKSEIDIVYAVLDHEKEYTIKEVENLIRDFKNRKVG